MDRHVILAPIGGSMTDWTDRELGILAALAETFVRGDGMARARLAADALSQAADPAQVAQLRQALWLMDTGAVNLVLAGRGQGIAAMSIEARERYLLSWGASRLPLRRAAFQSLRKLMSFLAYADPGTATEPNPLLGEIDYRPDRPPVTTDLAKIRPLRFEAERGTRDEPIILEADAVVVGSGAGGGVVAAELAEAGRSVVVVEAGPFVDESTMPNDELDAFARLYLNLGLLTTWDGSVTMLAGTGVGGGTLVNWMTSIAAPTDVRAEWSKDHGLEGVEDGTEWTADVAAIEADLGVAEATHIPPKDAIILRGARALGWEAAPTRRNAAQCGDCGSCPFGCRRGTKQSGIRAHLARAASAGARIVPDAAVQRVILEDGRAAGVEALLADGRRVVVRARTVVLAAGALRTPAILQRTGVRHGAIGRYLRLHPVTVVAGWFDEPVEMWRGTMQAARSLEFSGGDAGRRGYAIESAPGHPGLMALALPWEGREAHAKVMASAGHIAPFIAVTRDGGEGRATLTRAGRVRLDYRLDASGIATLRHALVQMARIARAAGASKIIAVGTPPRWHQADGGDEAARFARFEEALGSFDFGANRGAVFSAHQMGSVRMGSDVRSHPCDPWGRVRAGGRGDYVIRGLYVGDGSVFPTGIGVNPMITIMALARRVSRVILAET
jgi:choline dehydrogenase-like flavoprotein